MQDYTEEVQAGMETLVDEVGKQALKDIKAGSPVETGSYERGWTSKKVKSMEGVSRIIFNKYPHRPHLLEKGHANRDGGRTEGIPHIAPAEKKARERLIEGTKELLKR
ncbi:MAG: HK97 gp10 family phage protein [Butyricicoccus sp.]